MTEQLRTRLRQATDGHVSGIHVPDLVHRAQVSKRRHRYAATGAGVLAAAVLVGGGLAARAVLPSPDAAPQPGNPTGTGSPTGSPTVATEEKWQVLGLEDGERVFDEDVRIIREILDPDGTQIVGDPVGWDGTLSGAETTAGKDTLSLGIQMEWPAAGDATPRAISVGIATAWGGVADCDSNTCRDVKLPGGVQAKAIGKWSYAHQQADGTVIQIMAVHRGNDFAPLEDYGISEEQIAELLTNEDLEVPVKRVPIVPGMPVDDARQTLLAALGGDAGKYQHESGTDDDGTTLKGAFTGGGTLTVDLDEMTADLVASGGCRPNEPAVCEERSVDGKTVMTWSVMDQDPGNFQLVLVEGDQQRVYLSYYLPAGGQGALTLDELVKIAADDRWQQ